MSENGCSVQTEYWKRWRIVCLIVYLKRSMSENGSAYLSEKG